MTKKINFAGTPRAKNLTTEQVADDWVANGKANVPAEIETTRFTIDIPSELHRKIKSYCALKGVKMKEEIQTLLETHFSE